MYVYIHNVYTHLRNLSATRRTGEKERMRGKKKSNELPHTTLHAHSRRMRTADTCACTIAPHSFTQSLCRTTHLRRGAERLFEWVGF